MAFKLPVSDDLARGVGIGIGLAVLVPVAAVALAPVVRPLARAALKGLVLAVEMGREGLAGLGEAMQDTLAEVHDELREARAEVGAAAAAGAAAGRQGDASGGWQGRGYRREGAAAGVYEEADGGASDSARQPQHPERAQPGA